MKILFSHSYRLSLITKREGHFFQVLACEDALEEDVKSADEVFFTTHQNRVQEMLAILDDPLKRPDVLVLAAAHDDQCVEESAYLNQIRKKGIKVVGQPFGICELCMNKIKTKKFLESIDVPVTPLVHLHPKADISLPVVKKANQLWAGTGIEIIRTVEELEQQYEATPGDSFYEQFVKGIEMSVQVVRSAERVVVSPPIYKGNTSEDMVHPLKKLRIFPNPWHAKINQAMMDVAVRIANELQTQGAMDIEFVVQDEEHFYVMEINSRLSGVSRMIASGGQNVMDMFVSMADGSWVEYAEQERKVVAEVPFSTVLTDELLKKLKSLPYIDYVYVRADQSSGTRQRLLMKANTITQLKERVHELDSLISLDQSLLEELQGLVKMNALQLTLQ